LFDLFLHSRHHICFFVRTERNTKKKIMEAIFRKNSILLHDVLTILLLFTDFCSLQWVKETGSRVEYCALLFSMDQQISMFWSQSGLVPSEARDQIFSRTNNYFLLIEWAKFMLIFDRYWTIKTNFKNPKTFFLKILNMNSICLNGVKTLLSQNIFKLCVIITTK
jgi:hypothetical protein